MVENIKMKNKTVSADFTSETQGVVYKKVKDHGKEFQALIVPKALQMYVLYDSHNSLC